MSTEDQKYFERRLKHTLNHTGPAHFWTLQRGLCEVGRPDTRFDPRRMTKSLTVAHRAGTIYRMQGFYALSRDHYLAEGRLVAERRRVARLLQREGGLAAVESDVLRRLTEGSAIHLDSRSLDREATIAGRRIGLHFSNAREWLYLDSPWLWECLRRDLPHRIPVFVVGHAAYSTLLFFQLSGLTLLTTFKQYVRQSHFAEQVAKALFLTNVTTPVVEDRFRRFFDEVLPRRLEAWPDDSEIWLRRGFALAGSDLSSQSRRSTTVAAIQSGRAVNEGLADRCLSEFLTPAPPRILR